MCSNLRAPEWVCRPIPRAYVRGYILPPLRGWDGGEPYHLQARDAFPGTSGAEAPFRPSHVCRPEGLLHPFCGLGPCSTLCGVGPCSTLLQREGVLHVFAA
jgi:hypothetical protein